MICSRLHKMSKVRKTDLIFIDFDMYKRLTNSVCVKRLNYVEIYFLISRNVHEHRKHLTT